VNHLPHTKPAPAVLIHRHQIIHWTISTPIQENRENMVTHTRRRIQTRNVQNTSTTWTYQHTSTAPAVWNRRHHQHVHTRARPQEHLDIMKGQIQEKKTTTTTSSTPHPPKPHKHIQRNRWTTLNADIHTTHKNHRTDHSLTSYVHAHHTTPPLRSSHTPQILSNTQTPHDDTCQHTHRDQWPPLLTSPLNSL